MLDLSSPAGYSLLLAIDSRSHSHSEFPARMSPSHLTYLNPLRVVSFCPAWSTDFVCLTVACGKFWFGKPLDSRLPAFATLTSRIMRLAHLHVPLAFPSHMLLNPKKKILNKVKSTADTRHVKKQSRFFFAPVWERECHSMHKVFMMSVAFEIMYR